MGFHELEVRTQEIQAAARDKEQENQLPKAETAEPSEAMEQKNDYAERGRQVFGAKMEKIRGGLGRIGAMIGGGLKNGWNALKQRAGGAFFSGLGRADAAIEAGSQKAREIDQRTNDAVKQFGYRTGESLARFSDKTARSYNRTKTAILDLPANRRSQKWGEKLMGLAQAQGNIEAQKQAVNDNADAQIEAINRSRNERLRQLDQRAEMLNDAFEEMQSRYNDLQSGRRNRGVSTALNYGEAAA